MTATINIQSQSAMPEPLKPTLKAVDHPFKNIKNEQNTVQSIEPAETNKAENETEEKKSSEQKLETAVKQLNSYTQSINRNLEFKIDQDSGHIVVKVIDSETDELIRQIPNEEALNIAKQLDEVSGDDPHGPGLLLIKARA